ncbi:Spc98 family-domain-containing protein [Mycotypha africana]|uniref:Spc98 family-domain-containing protein n=1 Tax=Mycotypha africana TaxID=64632 RepID=UPI0022FFFAAB|nr:Spc98 family-domain-containing protein [Mycotypha africana]KAI8987874.1 Spc98 family-domain-containing protein [Mycotypha africana]
MFGHTIFDHNLEFFLIEFSDLRLKPLPDQPFDLFSGLSAEESSEQATSASTKLSTDHQAGNPTAPPESLWDSEIDMDDVPSDHSSPDEDIWVSQRSEPRTHKALSWDTRNSQFPTYEQKKLAKRNVGTPFLTEAPLSFFDPLIDRFNNTTLSNANTAAAASNTTTKVVYEIALVKALLQAMEGIPSAYFYWDEQESLRSRVNHSIRILGVSQSALQPMIDDILLFGTQLRALERIANTCKSQPEKYGLTGMAFGCCLAEVHMNIHYSMMNTFSETPSDYFRLSIIKLHQYTHQLSTIVHKLCSELCRCQIDIATTTTTAAAPPSFSLPFGAQWLNLLHAQVQQYDLALHGDLSIYKNICLVFLKYTSVPYLHMLSEWLHLSDRSSSDMSLDHWDPYGEFFIEQVATCQKDVMEQFQVRSEVILPHFIDEKLAQYILRSGISQRMLKRIKPDHPLFHLQDSFSLKYVLSNVEYSEYKTNHDHLCHFIQSYNRGDVINVDHYERVDEQQHSPQTEQQEEQEGLTSSSRDGTSDNDTLLQNIPLLPLLDESIRLSSEFMTCLNDLLSQQQQQQQQHHHHQNENEEASATCTKYTDTYIPTLNTITRYSYIQPLKQWCLLLNESFMLSFLKQYKLQHHLSLLSDVFFLKHGTFAAGLKRIFFPTQDCVRLDYRGNRWPPKAIELNMALRNLLLENKINNELEDDILTFTIRKPSDTTRCRWMDPHAVEALDFLKANYCAKYSLPMVMTPTIIHKYNRIFTFLLRLLRTSTVTKLCYTMLRRIDWQSNQTRGKLFQMCFQMDQFVNAIENYVHGTAIENTWTSFERNVSRMIQEQQRQVGATAEYDSDDNGNDRGQPQGGLTDYTLAIMEPYAFRSYHEHILDRILIQCFLKANQRRILNVLHPILQDIISFGRRIDDYYNVVAKTTTTTHSAGPEKDFALGCERIFKQFQANVQVFVEILSIMEAKGSGSLANILSETDGKGSHSHPMFVDLYCRNEAKEGLDNFARDLLIRLSFNHFYNRTAKEEV